MLSVEYIFINISFGCISSSGIVGSCGNFVSHFKDSQIIFGNSTDILHI